MAGGWACTLHYTRSSPPSAEQQGGSRGKIARLGVSRWRMLFKKENFPLGKLNCVFGVKVSMYGGQSEGVCCGADHSLLHWGVYVQGNSGESRQLRRPNRLFQAAKEHFFDFILKVCGVPAWGIGELGKQGRLQRWTATTCGSGNWRLLVVGGGEASGVLRQFSKAKLGELR